jgi:hypothetical protein
LAFGFAAGFLSPLASFSPSPLARGVDGGMGRRACGQSGICGRSSFGASYWSLARCVEQNL